MGNVRPISADSHVTEPPHCYLDHIEPEYRDRAPHLTKDPKGGDAYVIPGMAGLVQVGVIAAAGKDPKTVTAFGVPWEEIYRSSWDGKARVADQEKDGVEAEVLYPTIGMVICNHDDPGFKRACFRAYNQWLQEYVSAAPDRMYGLGQIAVSSIDQAIKDLEYIHAQGFKGVMLPGHPDTEFDYHDERFDPLWRAAVDLGMPVSFHIAAVAAKKPKMDSTRPALEYAFADFRGPKSNTTLNAIRPLQDVIGMFILGGVFERTPKLKLVCVEADAGWAPHYIQKMDWQYNRGRHWRGLPSLARMPSEYFLENVYVTFQDDKVAMDAVGNMNVERLLWASDFPHNDSTWPLSGNAIERISVNLTEQQKAMIFRENVVKLYGLSN